MKAVELPTGGKARGEIAGYGRVIMTQYHNQNRKERPELIWRARTARRPELFIVSGEM